MASNIPMPLLFGKHFSESLPPAFSLQPPACLLRVLSVPLSFFCVVGVCPGLVVLGGSGIPGGAGDIALNSPLLPQSLRDYILHSSPILVMPNLPLGRQVYPPASWRVVWLGTTPFFFLYLQSAACSLQPHSLQKMLFGVPAERPSLFRLLRPPKRMDYSRC